MFILERFLRSQHCLHNRIFTFLFYSRFTDFQKEPTLLDCKDFKAISGNFYMRKSNLKNDSLCVSY